MAIYIFTFILGAVVGGAWVLFVKGVAQQNRWRAALADVVILLPVLATYQIWAEMDDDWRILAVYALGSIIATFVLTGEKK